MHEIKITSSLEDYLEAIAELIELSGHAHTKEIAQKLNVKMPSVTNALQTLSNLGLIHYRSHYPVELTESGAIAAAEILRRHNALKTFFTDIIMLEKKDADETACRMEHVTGSDIVERLITLSDYIKNDPSCAGLRAFLSEKFNQST